MSKSYSEKNLPVITVITVVYNAVSLIESTIASVLDNDYKNLKYIIIDGASTDGTVEVIRRYEKRLTAFVSEKDNGIYDAMNKGWALAAPYSYILFLGAGDRLENLPADMNQYTVNDVIYGRVHLEGQKVFIPRAGILLRLYNTLHHQALLVNKSIHSKPPFNIRYSVYADFDFNQRLLKQGVNFVYSVGLVSYSLPDGVSHKTNLSELISIIRKNFGFSWSILSFIAFKLTMLLPSLRRFKPVVTDRQ